MYHFLRTPGISWILYFDIFWHILTITRPIFPRRRGSWILTAQLPMLCLVKSSFPWGKIQRSLGRFGSWHFFLYQVIQVLRLGQCCLWFPAFHSWKSSSLWTMVDSDDGIAIWFYDCLWSSMYTVTIFKYVEGGPDHQAPEVVWNTSSMRIFECLFRQIGFRMSQWPGR